MASLPTSELAGCEVGGAVLCDKLLGAPMLSFSGDLLLGPFQTDPVQCREPLELLRDQYACICWQQNPTEATVPLRQERALGRGRGIHDTALLPALS